MPSTDRKLELKAKTSMAQTASQAAVYAKGLSLFTNTFCTSACYKFLTYEVITVSNSLSVRRRSRYTADFAAPHR
jgi:hypothetical protein